MSQSMKDIFDRMKAGDPIRLDDPQYFKIVEVVNSTINLSAVLNTSTDVDQVRDRLGEIFGFKIDPTTTVFAGTSLTPLHPQQQHCFHR